VRRRHYVLVAILLVVAVAWQPVLYPGSKAALLLLDIYSPSLVGSDLAERITPAPRSGETLERIAGLDMRVSWWRPGWGDRHPGLMIVNGATPEGNDNAVTRDFAASLARAGYLVMLPEFPFLKEGRLDPSAPGAVDAAFGTMRSLPETKGEPDGVFGASVGAGLALVAAGQGGALSRAAYVAVLGSYFDIDAYIASVASHTQRIGDVLVRWEPSDEVKERLPPAVIAAMPDEASAAVIRSAFAASSYDDARARLQALSPRGRAILDALSPSSVWSNVRPPVFWIHDPNDSYEPVAEAYAAERDPHYDGFALVVPRIVQHAEIGESTKGQGTAALAGELWHLLTFTLSVLRIAG
jgi:hypothetical protein